ncbi:MAG: hypothetical protein WD691_10855 [Acidimicrobiales bacterium]
MTGDERQDHARAGVEHLQEAAREMIRATRSLLDAAEELVDDPSAVQSVVGTIASLAQVAASRLRSEGTSPGDTPGDDDDDGRVERIRVS